MNTQLPEIVLSRLECTQSKQERNFEESQSDYDFVKAELEKQYERLPDVNELLRATTQWGVTLRTLVEYKKTLKE